MSYIGLDPGRPEESLMRDLLSRRDFLQLDAAAGAALNAPALPAVGDVEACS